MAAHMRHAAAQGPGAPSDARGSRPRHPRPSAVACPSGARGRTTAPPTLNHPRRRPEAAAKPLDSASQTRVLAAPTRDGVAPLATPAGDGDGPSSSHKATAAAHRQRPRPQAVACPAMSPVTSRWHILNARGRKPRRVRRPRPQAVARPRRARLTAVARPATARRDSVAHGDAQKMEARNGRATPHQRGGGNGGITPAAGRPRRRRRGTRLSRVHHAAPCWLTAQPCVHGTPSRRRCRSPLESADVGISGRRLHAVRRAGSDDSCW